MIENLNTVDISILGGGLIFALILGFVIGSLVTASRYVKSIVRLERQNAELTTQIRAEKAALETAMAALDLRFKATAQEALSKQSEQFLQLAQEKLKAQQSETAHDLEKRQRAIGEMVQPVQKTLESLNQLASEAKGREETLGEEIKRLNKETARLVGALRDPAAQGQWGEFILEGLLEKSGLMKGVHYETQVSMQTSNGPQRPDAVINMQDGFHIVVDAKAPVQELSQRLAEDLSEADYQSIMQNLARQVREHVKKLGQKGYWENIDSVDFTVLFLPSEHLYSMALRADPSLVDFATSKDVIIASPTLLMSLLRVVGVSWRQVELAKNASEISERGVDLYKRLITFTSHIEKIGKNLRTANKGYDDAVGSLERSVLPAARKFKDLQGQTGLQDLQEIEKVDQELRELSLTEDDTQALKKLSA